MYYKINPHTHTHRERETHNKREGDVIDVLKEREIDNHTKRERERESQRD